MNSIMDVGTIFIVVGLLIMVIPLIYYWRWRNSLAKKLEEEVKQQKIVAREKNNKDLNNTEKNEDESDDDEGDHFGGVMQEMEYEQCEELVEECEYKGKTKKVAFVDYMQSIISLFSFTH